MSDDADRELVEGFLEALKRFDFDAVLAFMGDDIVYQNVPLPADRGKAQVARTLKRMSRFVDHFDVVTHHIAAANGIVLTERTDLLRGPLLDLKFWVCGTFEVRDGKIVVWRDYFDVPGFGMQLLTSPLRRLLGVRHSLRDPA